jgi:signal recognition particle receptor subunit beta
MHHKILFSGPVGAGKTTAIASISDTAPVFTEARARDRTRLMKEHTTVAMDYGVMALDGGDKVHLYGTPGQPRFDFMWDILAEGGLGIILLIDNSDVGALRKLRLFLDAFGEVIRRTQLVVGVTKMDLSRVLSLEDYSRKVEEAGIRAPVLEADVRQRRDVAILIEALLYSIDPGLDGQGAEEP